MRKTSSNKTALNLSKNPFPSGPKKLQEQKKEKKKKGTMKKVVFFLMTVNKK